MDLERLARIRRAIEAGTYEPEAVKKTAQIITDSITEGRHNAETETPPIYHRTARPQRAF